MKPRLALFRQLGQCSLLLNFLAKRNPFIALLVFPSPIRKLMGKISFVGIEFGRLRMRWENGVLDYKGKMNDHCRENWDSGGPLGI